MRDNIPLSLLQEFEDAFEASKTIPELLFPGNDRIVVILSGADTNSQETRSRIAYGYSIWKQVGSRDLFVLNGETTQLLSMRKTASDFRIPESSLYLMDCGAPGIANTRTQFDALNRFLEPAGAPSDIVLVTSAYHCPRVARQATLLLPENIDFQVVGVSGDESFARTLGEIRRILEYSEKGDIAWEPRQHTQ